MASAAMKERLRRCALARPSMRLRSSGSSRSVITLFSAMNILRIQKNTVYSNSVRQPALLTWLAIYSILSHIITMWITRDVEPKLQRSARTRPVMVLTGARQTGKTSTLLRLFPNHAFVSLDLPSEAEQAEKEPDNFLRRPAANEARGGHRSRRFSGTTRQPRHRPRDLLQLLSCNLSPARRSIIGQRRQSQGL